ncbi:hypothetical protein DSL92_01730 [Billgrantia gudaonensis]|uniref:Uncharacterized protein n=1 Tax=Billgrantia gudaonensis TaxID=376427 RepID=A0A432JL55_9GAMM|nr:hypothetical protein DSL92_01730 [Halomonas gudaonensis]
MAWLIGENQRALSQLCELVARLDAEDYAFPAGADGRHTLEACATSSITTGAAGGTCRRQRLDYERRLAAGMTSSSPRLAVQPSRRIGGGTDRACRCRYRPGMEPSLSVDTQRDRPGDTSLGRGWLPDQPYRSPHGDHRSAGRAARP